MNMYCLKPALIFWLHSGHRILHAYVDELRIKLHDILYITDQTTINFTKTRESTETVAGWILVLE